MSIQVDGKLPPCRIICVEPSSDPARVVPMDGAVVYRRARIGDLEITYAYPQKCIVSFQDTVIRISSSDISVEELERTSNYTLYLIERGTSREIYVLHSSVSEKLDKAIDIFMSGKTVGVILHGAPGTGKSSLLDIVKFITGTPDFEISPEKCLQHLLGKSEKAVVKVIKRSIRNAPSILFIDEADVWICTGFKRGEGIVSGGAGTESVNRNIRNILLRYLQQIHKQEPGVLILACTNATERSIDPAFKRPGRFDMIIHVPFPTWEMVYAYLTAYAEHIDSERIVKVLKKNGFSAHRRDLELFAKYLTNLGLAMADIVWLVEKCENAMNIAISKKQRGYSRQVSTSRVHFESEETPTFIRKLVAKIRNYHSGRVRTPPRIAVTRSIVEREGSFLPDQKMWLLPVIVHFLTLEGIPTFYLLYNPTDHSAVEECDVECSESKGVIILDMIGIRSIYADLVISSLILSTTSPLLAINAPPDSYKMFNIADRDVVDMIRSLVSRDAKKLIKVIIENLTTQGEVPEDVVNRARLMIHSMKDFEKLIREILNIVEEYMSMEVTERRVTSYTL